MRDVEMYFRYSMQKRKNGQNVNQVIENDLFFGIALAREQFFGRGQEPKYASIKKKVSRGTETS